MASLFIYVGVVTTMVVGRVSYWRESDGSCIIGLKPYSSGSLLGFDLFINLFLNGLFLWPLFRSRLMNPKIRLIALRTLIASSVALTTSLVNIGVLTHQRGHQLGWVCLGSCGTDVIINALAVFWVTKSSQESSHCCSQAIEIQHSSGFPRFRSRNSHLTIKFASGPPRSAPSIPTYPPDYGGDPAVTTVRPGLIPEIRTFQDARAATSQFTRTVVEGSNSCPRREASTSRFFGSSNTSRIYLAGDADYQCTDVEEDIVNALNPSALEQSARAY
ncbi:hypothetical protein AAF712_006068 [Marasmius tenuissimus]|uniref:Transmembrane protein n=1 Tax=Marasmius tenuissimus TaxID=585030 RepID=A0ABR3A1H5_9AGAR